MKLKDLSIERSLTAKHLGPRKLPVQGVILHDTAGSGKHNDTRYLADPSDGRVVSVDFTVERDGSIWQLNPDLKQYATWHAGRRTKFKGMSNRDVTRSCIGIEIVQSAKLPNPPYPAVQVDAVGQLCAALCGEFKLAPGDITTHAAVITDGSRLDPRKFPFDAFWIAFNAARGQGENAELAQTMPKIVEPTSPEEAYSVKASDTLTKIAKQFGVKVAALKARNGLTSDLILTGQALVIPAAP